MSKRSPDERSDIRVGLSPRLPGYRCAHPGYSLESEHYVESVGCRLVGLPEVSSTSTPDVSSR
ncbi:MAG TPA: hypothetical protein VMM15_35275 [Bradyrhizobium sp.]|nr:hypothetical protein [Bradyrhizobium sp.]